MSDNPKCEAVVMIDVRGVGAMSKPCKNEAKYQVTRHMTGVAQLLCGVHARAYVVGRKAKYADVRPLEIAASA